MAGPKRTTLLPAKKPKAKAAKPATATKPSLSSEFVVDSDDSGGTETTRENIPNSKIANPKSISTKPIEPKLSTSQGKPLKKRKSSSPSPAKDDSAESGSGNDSSSGGEERLSTKRILAVHNESPMPKPRSVTVRPISAKPSIKPSTGVKPLNRNEERRPGSRSKVSDSEAEESSEDSSNGSESGSGNESMSGSSDNTSLQSSGKKSPIQKSVSQRPEPTYDPPAGFESTSISVHPASTLSDILAPSNLEGKLIWHITVPESVPISLVKEVSTQNIGNGASILEHHGAKYGLVPESEVQQSGSRALLLPSTQTNNYRSSKTNITKTLHLQRIVSLPSHVLEPPVHPNRSASASESYRRSPRQQPEGLRMRYHPFGASDDSDSESTSEPIPKVPEFRIPAPVKGSSPERKRKRSESNDGSRNASSAVKSKKRKQSPHVTAGAIENPIDIDAISDKSSNGAESPTKSPHPEINGLRLKGKLPDGNETKEERRKRKDKKKLERQHSPSKPATALPLDVKRDAETMQPGDVVEGAPVVANAVEGTASVDGISSRKAEPRDEKRKRREERRRRKELERASRGASLVAAEDVSSQRDTRDQIMQEIEDAQRDASIPISLPSDGSPAKRARNAHVFGNGVVDSSQVSHPRRKETDEERAERKEERRRRRMERGSA